MDASWREIDGPPPTGDETVGFIGASSLGATGELFYEGIAANRSHLWIGYLE